MLSDMPRIGYGTWQRNGEEARRCTRAALEAGYRHIDTAEGYGNETEVGQGIADAGLPRGEIWVTTKVAPENFAPGRVRPHAEASLERLGLDRVDLLLAHWPAIRDEYEMEDYLGQFLEVKAAGLARHIGVSNFTRRHIDRAMEIAPGEILTNQVELHPFLHNTPIATHCRAAGIALTAYCPLARGRVADSPVLTEIGSAHGADAGQVALAWLLAKGHAVIPTSSKPARIAENLRAADVALSSEEMARIDALNRDERVVDGAWAPEWDA